MPVTLSAKTLADAATPHAQAETRDYAGAVLALTWEHAPQFRASLRATLDPAHLAHLAD